MNNATWFRKRKHDKVAKIVSALILAIALLNMHDMVFLLTFFYAVAIVGVVTAAVELHTILRK